MPHNAPTCEVAHNCTPDEARKIYNDTVKAQVLALSELGYKANEIACVTEELLAIARKLVPLKL
jgi:Holliday junction resolvasome RuvABC DNA-binding subunit